MKKIIALAICIALSTVMFSQNTASVKMQGGIFVGSNGTTTLVGFTGPKVSVLIPGKKISTEIGITGIPGLFLEKDNPRLGLSLGPTVSFSKIGQKQKLVIGVMIFKTTTWQYMPGVGWVF